MLLGVAWERRWEAGWQMELVGDGKFSMLKIERNMFNGIRAFIGQAPICALAFLAVYFVLDLPAQEKSHWKAKFVCLIVFM
jgi:hypothetical protein